MSQQEQLIVILDLALPAWKQASDLSEALSALSVFINVYLAQSQMHTVLFYLAGSGSAHLLWDSRQVDGLRFPLSFASERLLAALSSSSGTFRSGLPMAIGSALCRANRLRIGDKGLRSHGRLLVVTPGSECETGSQHVPLMNAAFCAQKMVPRI